MKNLILISGLALIVAVVSSPLMAATANAGASSAKTATAPTGKSKVKPPRDMKYSMGYFFGYSFGNMLKQGGNTEVNLDALQKGMRDSLAGTTPDMTADEQKSVIAVLQAERKKQMEAEQKTKAAADVKQTQEAKKNLETGINFMKQNARKPGVVATASGLQYQVIKAGTGKHPGVDDMVKVDYTGKLIDGKVFDSSKTRGPVEFQLKQVIPGWTEGLQLMKEGASYRLFIPPDLAYGSGGTHGIPPNSVLIFDVHLLKINPTTADASSNND